MRVKALTEGWEVVDSVAAAADFIMVVGVDLAAVDCQLISTQHSSSYSPCSLHTCSPLVCSL